MEHAQPTLLPVPEEGAKIPYSVSGVIWQELSVFFMQN
jgi:hypothetical protein